MTPHDGATLAALGESLRHHGLTARALAAWATARLSALPHLLAKLPRPDGTAGALLDLFVAGHEVPLARLAPLGDAALAQLHAHQLVDLAGPTARARFAVLPHAGALLVCDRIDAPPSRELACWPDDSSYHLAQSLPRLRTPTWIDLGCGSAFAPLAHPELAVHIAGTDLNPHVLACARLGAALSGVGHFHGYEGDLDEPLPPDARRAGLVTCNAPIPDGGEPGGYRPLWRTGTADVVARLVACALPLARPGGMIVLHTAGTALADALAQAPGERVLVTYTPPGFEPFTVAWWRPDAPDRLVAISRALTMERPHLTIADREAALGT